MSFNTPLEMHANPLLLPPDAKFDFQYSIGDAPLLLNAQREVVGNSPFNTPLEMRTLEQRRGRSGGSLPFQYSIGDAQLDVCNKPRAVFVFQYSIGDASSARCLWAGQSGRCFFQYSIGDAEVGSDFEALREAFTFNTPLEMHWYNWRYAMPVEIEFFQYSIGDAASCSRFWLKQLRRFFQYSIGDAAVSGGRGAVYQAVAFQYSIGDARNRQEVRSERRQVLSILHWRCNPIIFLNPPLNFVKLSILHWRCTSLARG